MSYKGLEGVWGGMLNGLSAQVIVVGASVLGFFWRDDYVAVAGCAYSPEDQKLSFSFEGGAGTLTSSGAGMACLEIREGDQIVILSLRRD
jgi:hypothetical protein